MLGFLAGTDVCGTVALGREDVWACNVGRRYLLLA
jgi:hypothetical protein